MKKYLLILSAGLFTLFAACNNEKKSDDAKPAENKVSPVAEKNLSAVHGINEAIKTGDVSKIDQYVAHGAISHAGPNGDMVANNMDSTKAYFAKIHTQFSDMKWEIIKEWADDDYVVQWVNFSGTSTTSESGVPAGKRLENVMEISISRLKDGKSVEYWELMQPGDLMKMMGGPQPGK
jgi:predicted ester cyclase